MRRQRRYNKRGNNAWNAKGYDSKFEATVGEALKNSGVVSEHQPAPFTYTRTCKYTSDFKVTTKSGKVIYIETKGYWTASDRSKHKLVCAANPGVDIRLVFQNSNNRLNKGSNTTYGAWCDRYKVKWAHLKIPDEWLEE